MRLWILLKYSQFKESCQTIGVRNAITKLLFGQWTAIPVVKPLKTVEPLENENYESLQFIEISGKNDSVDLLSYAEKSRKYKMQKYLKDGCGAFLVLADDEIAGDVWFSTAKSEHERFKDLEWLNIQLTSDDVYMFDMFVKPQKRGKHVTDFLVNRSLLAFQEKGYKNVYGYYDADNIAALWFHRMHGYKELDKLIVKQFFLTKKVSPVANDPK